MKNTALSTIFIFFLPVIIQAEIQWQTTHGNMSRGSARLEENIITVTVFPDYLDVEEEAVIKTMGTITNTGDPNSLELYGEFSLSENSSIVGMLLWNGEVILKAKLKPKALANKEYEEVVDRNITPPPRPKDPALIEFLGDNRYRVKIYPVQLGNSRKIRLRYHVPCVNGENGIETRLKPVFGTNLKETADNIMLILVGDDSSRKYRLKANNMRFDVDLPFVVLGSPKEEIIISERVPIHTLAAYTTFTSGQFRGNYINLYAKIPDTFINNGLRNSIGGNVLVQLSSKTRNYSVEINCFSDLKGCDALEFHGKSESEWKKNITWKIFDTVTGNLLSEVHQEIEEIKRPLDTAITVVWASSGSPLSDTEENYLGARYGFIDGSVSLLALEEDSLGFDAQRRWERSGVPRLTPVEIIKPDSAFMAMEDSLRDEVVGCMDPSSIQYDERATIHDPLLCSFSTIPVKKDKVKTSVIKQGLLITNDQLVFMNTSKEYSTLTIVDYQGKTLKKQIVESGEQFCFDVSIIKPGRYFLIIKTAGVTYVRQLLIK
ncbi:MAG: hypothetical protein HQK83_13220 [Fibrobacteria bacterium]|nr:hypothetical protein [Fibrobacteria bacterium]